MKIAIVTGSSGGLGQSAAELLAEAGYDVHGIDIEENVIPNIIPDNKFKKIDLRDADKLSSHISAFDRLGDNSVLVNCAGIREIVPIDKLSLAQWNDVFAVNVTAPFAASQAFCQRLIDVREIGSVINIASVSGTLGEPNRTAYVSSKHALIGLTKQLAIEYGKFGIRANSISPGVIRTPLTEAYYDNESQINKIMSGQFVGTLGTPNDVARLIEFLASDESKFITGADFVVDGGWLSGKRI